MARHGPAWPGDLPLIFSRRVIIVPGLCVPADPVTDALPRIERKVE